MNGQVCTAQTFIILIMALLVFSLYIAGKVGLDVWMETEFQQVLRTIGM